MITIVSGLPRSGTSMMMQMLKSGGIPILTDNIRKPDHNNPKGYFELEKVKRLEKDNSWIGEAEGKAVKIIAQLLRFLPQNYRYKIIFMERDIREILKSQEKMLIRLGNAAAGGDSAILEKAFLNDLSTIKKQLSDRAELEVLYVNHREIIQNPLEKAGIIKEFLGKDLDIVSMAHSVDGNLYRERND